MGKLLISITLAFPLLALADSIPIQDRTTLPCDSSASSHCDISNTVNNSDPSTGQDNANTNSARPIQSAKPQNSVTPANNSVTPVPQPNPSPPTNAVPTVVTPSTLPPANTVSVPVNQPSTPSGTSPAPSSGQPQAAHRLDKK